jgi:hypothetical protein
MSFISDIQRLIYLSVICHLCVRGHRLRRCCCCCCGRCGCGLCCCDVVSRPFTCTYRHYWTRTGGGYTVPLFAKPGPDPPAWRPPSSLAAPSSSSSSSAAAAVAAKGRSRSPTARSKSPSGRSGGSGGGEERVGGVRGGGGVLFERDVAGGAPPLRPSGWLLEEARSEFSGSDRRFARGFGDRGGGVSVAVSGDGGGGGGSGGVRVGGDGGLGSRTGGVNHPVQVVRLRPTESHSDVRVPDNPHSHHSSSSY